MATEKIFFSYSRSDSTFVLKLAKDLRDAGVELWLDQLDIKPGSHWDSSIQDALGKTHCLIVVLSPSSVASDNVMDEVSFALENKKTVIPVLLSECSPPFRLMRLQRLDFTGNYQTGLDQLIIALGQTSASNVKNENTAEELQENKRKSEVEQRDKELERLLWEKAKKEHSFIAYNHYIEEFPEGVYKADALAKIKSIQETEKHQGMIASKNDTGSDGSFSQMGKRKKYLFLSAAVVVIAIVIWGIIQSGKGSKSQTATDQKIQDSMQAAILKIKNDSIANMKKIAAAELLAKDSIKMGKYFRGGIIFYIDQKGEHGLITSQYDQGKDLNWYKESKILSGAFAVGIFEGAENTKSIVSKMGEGNYPAKLCDDLVFKGYSDWYLPSKEELNELFERRKEIGGFADKYYWSSTEVSNADVWYQSFFNGKTYKDIKGNKANVRAIRRF